MDSFYHKTVLQLLIGGCIASCLSSSVRAEAISSSLFPTVESLIFHEPTTHEGAVRETISTSHDDGHSGNQPMGNDGDDRISDTSVGYDAGFVIASKRQQDLNVDNYPFQMKISGWGQLRHTIQDSYGTNADVNQIQLKRARLTFAGSAFTPEFSYFLQIDGRSSSGDGLRLLDYFLTYDFGKHVWGCENGTIGLKTGKYKIPFTMARYLSGKEFEFADRSMASTFFDVNRSLALGLYGRYDQTFSPLHWEMALFNGLVTGGAETGSSGTLDDNFAYSARIFCFPIGEWGRGSLADFDWHEGLATRIGVGFANSTIEKTGSTEFDRVRVVDSGFTLGSLLPDAVEAYETSIYSVDMSGKWRGWSATAEYYFRQIDEFAGGAIPSLSDQGFWLQLSKFVVPDRLQLLSRWSRVDGESGTLGEANRSAEEIAGGFVLYFRDQHAKLTADVSYLDGAPINSAALDIAPGDMGWLIRSQIQFAF